MAIAELGEETVALQPVGDHDGTRLDGFLYERKQALRRGAHHAPHSDPANRSAAHLRANYDKCLLSDVPAVTDVWCPQLPHIQSPRPVHHAWVPSQVGHTNPWGHRSRAR